MTLPRHLIGFAEALRTEGVAIGTSELNDAFAALGEVEWTRPAPFKEALAATLAKSPDDRRVFDLVFERYFFRATEGAALEAGVREGDAPRRASPDGDRIDFDALREQILEAIRAGDEAALRDLARLAIAAFGRRGEGSGVLGVDVQRIRRALGLKSEPQRPGQGRGRRAGAAAHARPDPRLRGPPAARARARADRAHAGAAAVTAAERARPRAPVRPRAGPRRRAPRRHAAQAPARHPGPPGARPRPPRARRRAQDDARLAGDRRRPGRPQVQAQAPAPPRALRALRRVHERHERVRLLPERPARPARQLPPHALLRLRRAHLRGHRRLRPRARLQGRQRRDLQGRRRRRRLRLHRLRPRLARVPRAASRTTCTRARP